MTASTVSQSSSDTTHFFHCSSSSTVSAEYFSFHRISAYSNSHVEHSPAMSIMMASMALQNWNLHHYDIISTFKWLQHVHKYTFQMHRWTHLLSCFVHAHTQSRNACRSVLPENSTAPEHQSSVRFARARLVIFRRRPRLLTDKREGSSSYSS